MSVKLRFLDITGTACYNETKTILRVFHDYDKESDREGYCG